MPPNLDNAIKGCNTIEDYNWVVIYLCHRKLIHCYLYVLQYCLFNVFQVWEIVYSKDGSVKEVSNVMQLKGHKV